MGDGSVEQAVLEAQRQAVGWGPAYRSSNKDEHTIFSGKFISPELPEEKKGQYAYGLAVLSDDGCNVKVGESIIHQRVGQRQHLPSLGESFHELQVILAPGEPVDLQVEYSNVIYDDDPKSPGYPDIDGCSLFLYLIPMGIAVDANRDGKIAFSGENRDFTSEQAPFRFWCNDDNDQDGEGEESLSGAADSTDDEIRSLRDLEDFTRLHLYIGAFQDAIANGRIQIGLEWRQASAGSPSIKLYRAAEPDGGDKYLKRDNTEYYAGLQQASPFKAALGTIGATPDFKFPSSFWQSTGSGIPALGADSPKRCVLFEGATEGKGVLAMTFWQAGQKIGEGGRCWLEIKNIKKMYQRVDSAVAHPWEDVAFEPVSNEPKEDIIIFVHGWRMSPNGAGSFAETM